MALFPRVSHEMRWFCNGIHAYSCKVGYTSLGLYQDFLSETFTATQTNRRESQWMDEISFRSSGHSIIGMMSNSPSVSTLPGLMNLIPDLWGLPEVGPAWWDGVKLRRHLLGALQWTWDEFGLPSQSVPVCHLGCWSGGRPESPWEAILFLGSFHFSLIARLRHCTRKPLSILKQNMIPKVKFPSYPLSYTYFLDSVPSSMIWIIPLRN